MILAIKTDNPLAEIYLVKDKTTVDSLIWQADRKLSDDIFIKIEELLNRNSITWNAIDGLVVYKGPGSFTGLRIGITVFNTLAYSLPSPIVGTAGERWLTDGIDLLGNKENHKIITPEYGADPNITKPKK
jgi:tRNA threonylcarbamoyladenosine biosynthesis protein TsaB